MVRNVPTFPKIELLHWYYLMLLPLPPFPSWVRGGTLFVFCYIVSALSQAPGPRLVRKTFMND